MKYCESCGEKVADNASSCPKCGHQFVPDKSKLVAGILALFLGGIGIHKFYMGSASGIWYLLFCWTYIPAIIAFIEGIIYLCETEDKFRQRLK